MSEGVARAVRIKCCYSMTRSNSLREARRAGLYAVEPDSGVRRADAATRARGWTKAHLKTTISAFCVRRKQAQKIAMLNAVADARGRRKTVGVARPCVRKLRPGHSCQTAAAC